MMSAEPLGARRRWFTADGCRLAIDEQGSEPVAAVRAISDAILLGAHDELPEIVHRWTGIDHDWTPAAVTADAVGLTHSVSSGEPHGARAQQLGLVLNEDMVAKLQPLEPSLAAKAVVEAHAIRSGLILDRLSLSVAEGERLANGSLLLLPASFAENWIASLACEQLVNADEGRRTASVFVQPGTGMVYFRAWENEDELQDSGASRGSRGSGGAGDSGDSQVTGSAQVTEHVRDSTDAGSSVLCAVHLDSSIRIALDEWLDADPVDGTCAMTDAFRRPRLRLEIDGRVLPATLLPIGDGYAALVGEPTWT